MAIGSLTSFQNNAVKRLAVDVSRKRQVYDSDGMGNRIGTPTETTIDVKVIFDNITKKNLQFLTMGYVVPGSSKIYYDADQDIIEGDIIIYGSTEWKVQKITNEWFAVFSEAEVQKLTLNGS